MAFLGPGSARRTQGAALGVPEQARGGYDGRSCGFLRHSRHRGQRPSLVAVGLTLDRRSGPTYPIGRKMLEEVGRRMTEQEWLTCPDPQPMIRAIGVEDFLSLRGYGRGSWGEAGAGGPLPAVVAATWHRTGPMSHGRKLRLFGCACCRSVWGLLDDERCRAAVEVAERFADGLATQEEMDAARVAALLVAKTVPDSTAASWAIKAAARLPVRVASSGASGVAGYLVMSPTGDPCPATAKAQAALLRDFVPSLAPSLPAPSGCRTPDVLAIAQGAYQGRGLPSGHLEAARLAVLADAIEDAGCTHQALLDHLRAPGPRFRGFWALDLILGLE